MNTTELNLTGPSDEGTQQDQTLILTETQIELLTKIPRLDFLDFFQKMELAEQIKKITDEECLVQIKQDIDDQLAKFEVFTLKMDKRLYFAEKKEFGI